MRPRGFLLMKVGRLVIGLLCVSGVGGGDCGCVSWGMGWFSRGFDSVER